MRLIDTLTYVLVDYPPKEVPPYAILSHTWEGDEYVYADRDQLHRRHSTGFRKIFRCCALAASEGWDYLWVDTCCIDKSSSAELTESINSMYRWYQEAQICYVYLSDFSLERQSEEDATPFQKSRWFTRGWTLQELLAPETVFFYDKDWIEIGSKICLEPQIEDICRISPRYLKKPKTASIAMKMAWMSKRQTSREEDMAYSLLGLFDINMPLIYGEGSNAFYRLQCEIIQSDSDESIFAWEDEVLSHSGLLARGPWAFQDSYDIVPIYIKGLSRRPYYMTNQGLAIELNVRRIPTRSIDHEKFTAFLACARSSDKEAPLMLALRITHGETGARESCKRLMFGDRKSARELPEQEKVTFHVRNYYSASGAVIGDKKNWLPVEIVLTSKAKSQLRFTAAYPKLKHNMTTTQDGEAIRFYFDLCACDGECMKQLVFKYWDPAEHMIFIKWIDYAPGEPSEIDILEVSRPVQGVKMGSTERQCTLGKSHSWSLALAEKVHLWVKTKVEKVDSAPRPMFRLVVAFDISTFSRCIA